MNLKSLILAGMFAASFAQASHEQNSIEVVCVEEQKSAPEAVKVSNMKYFAAHLATGALGLAVMASADTYIDAQKSDLAKFIATVCLGVVMWSMPQWTDRLLGIKNERTFGANLGSLFMREILPYPIGTLTSELCIQNHHE